MVGPGHYSLRTILWQLLPLLPLKPASKDSVDLKVLSGVPSKLTVHHWRRAQESDQRPALQKQKREARVR